MFVFTLLFGACTAQAENARFDNLWIEDGLPGKTVWDVAEDSLGFVWIAGLGGMTRFDGHRASRFPFPHTVGDFPRDTTVRSLAVSGPDVLWMGTLRHGLFRADPYATAGESVLAPVDVVGTSVRALIVAQDNLWIGSSAGLERIHLATGDHAHFPLPEFAGGRGVFSLADWGGRLTVGHAGGLAIFNEKSSAFTQIAPALSDVRALETDSSGRLWIGGAGGLSLLSGPDESPESISDLRNHIVWSLEKGPAGDLWVGTQMSGLFRVRDKAVESVFESRPRVAMSLADATVTSIQADSSGVLWFGTFSGGVDRLDPLTLNFGWHDADSTGFECLPDEEIYLIQTDRNRTLWVGTSQGLIRHRQGECSVVHNPDAGSATGLVRDTRDRLWQSGSSGISQIIEKDGQLNAVTLPETEFTFFLFALQPDRIIAGTPRGLVELDPDRSRLSPAAFFPEKVSPREVVEDNTGRLWFATDKGVFTWDGNGVATAFIVNAATADTFVDHIFVDGDQTLWIAFRSLGLFRVRQDGEVLVHIDPSETATVAGILEDAEGGIWISTTDGLLHLNSVDNVLRKFVTRDGLQSNSFIRGSAHKAADGKLYFGGRRGWNAFFPQSIRINTLPPSVSLTRITRYNETLTTIPANDGVALPEPAERLRHLRLNHDDDVIGIEFSALHFSDPERNRFRYRLQGFDDQWFFTPAAQRIATYTNLPWGTYEFQVQAANKDGVWSPEGARLSITVRTPLWARWWALAGYALLILLATASYGQLRSRVAIKRARELQQQVEERTRDLAVKSDEIAHQKDVIEDLLAKKNALFANVSHEFRTPLTLILGPLKSLMEDARLSAYRGSHKLIYRNATRLLRLVDQLLDLARSTRMSKGQMMPTRLAPALEFLVTSYRVLAEQKDIELELSRHADCTIHLVNDGLELMVGNLLSNAIKYTPNGGRITVAAVLDKDTVAISVTDDGPGMSDSEKEIIFDRFTRLEKGRDQDGTGIGLALVKEVAHSHGGTIGALDAPHGGCVFLLRLPATPSVMDDSETSPSSPEVIVSPQPDRSRKKAPTVLIVEDFEDMRNYIAEALGTDFHCVSAENGVQGIASALDVVPDLIVSDIMMPEMDGFEFCKQIRADDRLSHIPVVLLTARGGKESRMQGWESFADDYMVKPFDADELRLRIHSLLAVRARLGREVREDIENGNQNLPKLNKRERAFVEKITAIISRRYSETRLSRADLAADMAVSERQLQRKLKALIDQNPSDYLREIRLRKACEKLREGHQVTLVGDACGFSSASQFSHAFKRRFAQTPKQYQKAHSQL